MTLLDAGTLRGIDNTVVDWDAQVQLHSAFSLWERLRASIADLAHMGSPAPVSEYKYILVGPANYKPLDGPPDATLLTEPQYTERLRNDSLEGYRVWRFRTSSFHCTLIREVTA